MGETEVARMHADVQKFSDSLVGITRQHGGYLRCETCKRTGGVLPEYWQVGWPKCCGYTMRWWTQRQVDAGEVPDD